MMTVLPSVRFWRASGAETRTLVSTTCESCCRQDLPGIMRVARRDARSGARIRATGLQHCKRDGRPLGCGRARGSADRVFTPVAPAWAPAPIPCPLTASNGTG